jgi:hypothetical protein
MYSSSRGKGGTRVKAEGSQVVKVEGLPREAVVPHKQLR